MLIETFTHLNNQILRMAIVATGQLAKTSTVICIFLFFIIIQMFQGIVICVDGATNIKKHLE